MSEVMVHSPGDVVTSHAAIGDRFRDQGYCAPIRVMSEEEARRYRAQLEDSERRRGRPLNLEERHKPHLLFRWAADLVHHPAVLDAVEPIVGPNLLVWDVTLFTKEAGGREHLTWHQDLAYWGLDPGDQVITAWIALSPSTVESGCMRVVRGSHRLPIKPHVNSDDPTNLLGRGQTVQAPIDPAEIVDVVLQPGEMSLHGVNIIHGSESNRSSDRRIGFGIRYFPPHVRQTAPVRDTAYLARGVDPYGHFDLEHEPAVSDSPEAHAAHAAARAQRKLVKGYI